MTNGAPSTAPGSKRVEFWDTTLRDAQQSLWATRMSTDMMTPIVPVMDEAGYFNIEVGAGVMFDACVYHLKENPFDRLRTLARLLPKTPISHGLRGQNVFSWDIVADDVIDLVVPALVACGVRRLMVFDSMNDLRNTARIIRIANDLGVYIIGLLVYTISPVHTDAYYAEKAKEYLALGVDDVELKDPASLLTPDRVRTLVPALKQAIAGDDGQSRARLHIHTHCTTGLGPLVYLDALDLGADVFHTCTGPLANGASQPAVELIAAEARNRGFEVPLDDAVLARIATYIRELAIREGKPLGHPAAYDPAHYRHQVPGGMISNLESQLAEIGMAGRMSELLEEIFRVREELGYPIMVSPLSQFVAVQALLNLVQSERYGVVPVDIRKYALGWYGRPAVPIDPNLLDHLTEGAEPITERPGALIPPMIERFRKDHGPFDSDEDLILALFYKPKVMEEYRAAQAGKASARTLTPHTPVAKLIAELAKRPEVSYLHVDKAGTKLTHVA